MKPNFLTRAFDKYVASAVVRLSEATADFFGGGNVSSSGESVTPNSAMQVATAYCCIRILAEGLASLPITVYRTDAQGKRTPDKNHWMYDLLALKPNAFQTSFEFREMMAATLCLRGAYYARIYWDNATGGVSALVPLHPDRVSVNFNDQKTELVYTVTYENGSTETLKAEDVLHIRGLHSDVLTPISPIAAATETLGLEQSLQKHQGKSFGPNAARPGGVIEAEGKVAPETALRIMKLFNSNHAGGNNAGKTLFLDRGMTFKGLAISNEDAQFLETRKFSVEEICRIFNVPPSLVHHNYNSTYSNAEQQVLAFVKFSLRPLIIRVEEALSQALLTTKQRKKLEIDLDLSDLMRGDAESTANFVRNLVSGGVLTPNEGRERVGVGRHDDDSADKLYMQTAMAPVDKLEQALANKSNSNSNNQNDSSNSNSNDGSKAGN